MQTTAISPNVAMAQALAQTGVAQAGTAQGGDFMQMIMQMMGQGGDGLEGLMDGTASMDDLLGLTGKQGDEESAEDADYLMQLMASMLGHGMPQVAMYNTDSTTPQQSADAAMEILSAVQAGLQAANGSLQGAVQLPPGAAVAANLEANSNEVLPDGKVTPFTAGKDMPMEVVTQDYSKNEQSAVGKTDGGQSQILDAFMSVGKPQNVVMRAMTGEKLENIDIDALQQMVDGGRYLNSTTTSAQEIASANPQTMDILAQVKTGILANMDKGSNEFVIKLKPEGLGEITVKMTEAGGKISLSIITGSQHAQNAISGEIASLREALRPYNAEVSQVITQQDANMSQGFGEHKHSGTGQEQRENRVWIPQAEDEKQQLEYASTLSSALNAYI